MLKNMTSVSCNICRTCIDDETDTSWYCKDCGVNLCNECYIVTAFGSAYIADKSNEERAEKYQQIIEDNEELFASNKPRLHSLEIKGNIRHRPSDSQYFRKNTPNKNSRPKPIKNIPQIDLSENDVKLSSIQNVIAKEFDDYFEDARDVIKETCLSKKEIKKPASPKPVSPKPKPASPKRNVFVRKNVPMYLDQEEVPQDNLDRSLIPKGYVAYKTPNSSSYNKYKILKLKDIMYQPNQITKFSSLTSSTDPRLIPEGYVAIEKSIGPQWDWSLAYKILTYEDALSETRDRSKIIEKEYFDESVLPFEN